MKPSELVTMIKLIGHRHALLHRHSDKNDRTHQHVCICISSALSDRCGMFSLDLDCKDIGINLSVNFRLQLVLFLDII